MGHEGIFAGKTPESVNGEHSGDIVGLDFRAPRAWLALIAVTRREQKAADRLREFHIRAYWPNYVVSEGDCRLPSGRMRRSARLRAIIPGFIFVAVRAHGEIDLSVVIEETPGLIGYMRDGAGFPAKLTELDITRIREIETDQNKPLAAKHVHNFKVGQRVRFKLYPAWAGTIEGFCSDGRISVGVPMLGQIAPAKGLPHQIEMM